MDKETFFEEYKGVVIAGVAVFVLGIVLLLNFIMSTKQLLMFDLKQTSIKAGDPLTIQWGANNIDRVGIVLFDGDKPQWIVQNLPASAKKYTWNSLANLDAGNDYRVAIFEYPWLKGNMISYASNTFEIIGQKYASCDDFSVEQQWPNLADNYANARKIFITSGVWTGNLGGIDGADGKCNQEAKSMNYAGNYIAFIGSDTISAVERITKPGVFIEAVSSGSLPNGRTCHRLVAQNLQILIDKTKLTKEIAQIQLSDAFARRLGDVWYGRRTSSAETKCLLIGAPGFVNSYSGTHTCQNWATDKRQVYPGPIPETADLPKCYDLEGKNVFANYFGAGIGTVDKEGTYTTSSDSCDAGHRLICIEQ